MCHQPTVCSCDQDPNRQVRGAHATRVDDAGAPISLSIVVATGTAARSSVERVRPTDAPATRLPPRSTSASDDPVGSSTLFGLCRASSTSVAPKRSCREAGVRLTRRGSHARGTDRLPQLSLRPHRDPRPRCAAVGIRDHLGELTAPYLGCHRRIIPFREFKRAATLGSAPPHWPRSSPNRPIGHSPDAVMATISYP